VLVVVLLGPGSSAAERPYSVGDRIAPLTLPDQFGEEWSLDTDARVLLFSRDMAGGRILKAALADATKAAFSERRMVYLSDLGGMPAVVTRLIALPNMRKRPYRMMIDRDGSHSGRFPNEAAHASLLFLDALSVVRIVDVASAEALRAELGLEALKSPEL
jgi:urease beta subunit